MDMSIIMTEENNEFTEKDRKERSSNLIIHGKKDKNDDKVFVTKFFEVVGVNVKPEQINRIGKSNDECKKNPIIIKFSNEDDK